MKILALEYSGYKFDEAFNLGDDIQTIAACNALGHVDGRVSRERLNRVDEPCIVCLNGFFMGSNNWPPSDFVIPIFFSFHISPKFESVICSPKGLEYLRRFQPIGCRDSGTVAILHKHGVEAYYSKCLTLTFDRRTEVPRAGKVYVVGVNKRIARSIPEHLRRNAITVNQSKIQLPDVPTDVKLALANGLLDTYRSQASLVITSKIHCAMPCIAMGIPVVFLYDRLKKDDYRVNIIKDLSVINYLGESWIAEKLINPRLSRNIDWAPSPVDMEDEKNKIRTRFAEAVGFARQRYRAAFGA